MAKCGDLWAGGGMVSLLISFGIVCGIGHVWVGMDGIVYSFLLASDTHGGIYSRAGWSSKAILSLMFEIILLMHMKQLFVYMYY